MEIAFFIIPGIALGVVLGISIIQYVQEEIKFNKFKNKYKGKV
jgi:hypothetical protein